MMTEPLDRDERVRAAVRSHIAAQPVPPPNLARIVARAERGARPARRPRWMIQAVAAAVAVVVCATVTSVTLTRQRTGYGVAPVYSPDRIPDFTQLPAPEVVWPDAVRRLPLQLPDESRYRITDTTGGDDLLVVSAGREAGPLFFDPDTGAVRRVATPSVADGLNAPKVSTALIAGDRVVWFVTGRRAGEAVREAWTAPRAGGAATKLADLPASAIDARPVLAGEAVIWEQGLPGGGKDDIVVKRLSLRDGKVGDVPGSRGYWLSTIPGWITSQYGGTPFGEPERSGTLIEVATGRRVHWKANDEMTSSVYCGPDWCTGGNVAQHAALQGLDGGGYLDLGEIGHLSPGLEGRLATGTLDMRQVVWDRGSGRAAEIKPGQPRERLGGFDPAFSAFGSGHGSPALVWWTQDGTPMMLDLKRLW